MLRTFTLDYRPLGRCFSLWLCLLFSTFGALANNGDKPFAEAGNPALPEAQPLPRFKAKIPQEYAAIIRERELQREIAAMPAALTYRQFGELETQTASTYTAADLFLEEGILLTPNSFDSVQYYIGQARAVLGKIRETGNYIRNFDAKTKVNLPAGIPKTIGGIDYLIGIAAIRLKPTHAEFDAFMEITLPQNGQQLVFMARGIKFSDGGGIVGDARLELVSDYAINFDNNKMQLVLKGTANSPTGTYVSMDCDGFKELGLEAELLFSRDMLLPEHYNGNIAEGRVTSSFSTIITDWNDLIVDVSLPSFQVPQLKGVGFTVQNAVFDYSDLRNAPSVVFPESYESADFLGDSLNLWRGFYLRELSIRLPEQFKTKDSQGRIEFAAYDMLIDKHGFSGLLEARNILDLGKGDMNGWSFSVNSFSAEVQTNQLVGAGFGGQIVVPISNSSTPFTYSAFINPGDNYIFSVSPEKQMDFPLWKAGEVEIYEASYLQVQVVDKKFYPSANLHGKMSITAGDSKLSIADIRFEDLYIRSEKPFVSVGAFSVGSEAAKQGLGNFPLSVNNIGFATPGEGELALKFDVVVNLVGENDGAFGGTAGLMIVGKLDEGGEYQSWKYNRVDLTKIGVNFNTGPVIVAASLEWYKQDPTYGDGFRGEAMLEVIDKIKVEAVALFGANADTRYWFVDALATLPPGAGSGIELRSIGGGAYYHMAQTSGSASPLGASLSGIVYKPDASVGLGLRATVDMVTAGSDKVFNGDATLEIAFNAGGGLKFIDLKGNGYFVTPALQINQEALKARVGGFVAGAANKAINMAQPKAQISANVHINYDNLNRTLHGNFEVFVNVAMGVMRGVGANNRAGWAVMHFAPDEWYIHIGSPDDPLGLELMRVARSESYFMVGHNIPGSPAPPSNVSEILGGVDLNYMDGLNELGEGKGIAFGSRFDMDTGDLSFLMFYARFAAGMGFDVMVKDYGPVSCAGREGPMGINGWYANGQAFAYFQGAVGIKVKLFGQRRQVEILEIGAAAILQAKLPNPFWMRGMVGGHFSVLNGLVKGNCKFEVTIGEECQIQGGSALENIQVIAGLTPAENEKEVSVFNAPQALFTMEVGKVLELVDLDGAKKTFRIKLDHFNVLNGSSTISGALEWNHEQDVVAFNAFEVLPSEQKLVARVQISFEELRGAGWVPVTVNGQKVIENKQIGFTTGQEPDYIPLENVAYSYPTINQLNFHKDEVNYGYIQLKTAQVRPFEKLEGMVQKGRFRTAAGESQWFEFAYDRSKGRVSYNLPNGLHNDAIYGFELLHVPVATAGPIDQNVQKKTASLALNTEDTETEIELSSKEAEGSLALLQEKSIFGAHFRTSRYSTFSAKVAAMSLSSGWSWPVLPGVHELGVNISGNESFDQYELQPQAHTAPLVQFEADATVPWFAQDVNPLVYQGYGSSGLAISWRTDLDYMGVPPLKAIQTNQGQTGLQLTEAQVSANMASVGVLSGVFLYNLPYVMYRDFNDLAAQAAAKGGSSGSYYDKLIRGQFPSIRSGMYKMKIMYVLPGTTQAVSSRDITIRID